MTYGSLDVVKDLLNLDDDFVEWDNRIDMALDAADTEIDIQLQLWGATIPLTTVPTEITHISNFWAAGITRSISTNPTALSSSVNDPGPAQMTGAPGREDVFIIHAKAMLKEYIRLTYGYIRLSKSGPPIT